MALTASSVVLMPLLGRAKHRLGAELGSNATAGEGCCGSSPVAADGGPCHDDCCA